MIGIFDSGFGGLTIMRAIVNHLPQYSYIYFGDNARAPYGPRTTAEIFKFVLAGVEYLLSQGTNLIILGCNTASVVALRKIQQQVLPDKYPDKRVLGIVVPTIEQITGVLWQQTKPTTTPISSDKYTVAILATQATVSSGVYEVEIHKRNPSIEVIQLACPNLTEAIENNSPPDKLDHLVEKYISMLFQNTNPDTLRAVILGCTHFALIPTIFSSHLPPHTRLYEQPLIVADSLTDYLSRHPEIDENLAKTSQHSFLTTGQADQIASISSRYYGQPIDFQHVDL